MNKAIFLDRDGVINIKPPEHDYIRRWEDFHFLPKAINGLAEMRKMGYICVIVTNQRGIARGLFSEADLEHIHQQMGLVLEANAARIDGIYVCPHESGTCDCRKPQTGLFRQAAQAWDIDVADSWMIGDSLTDMIAGRNFGLTTIFVGNESADPAIDYCCNDLEAAAKLIRGMNE